jgi:hypothetical protein
MRVQGILFLGGKICPPKKNSKMRGFGQYEITKSERSRKKKGKNCQIPISRFIMW